MKSAFALVLVMGCATSDPAPARECKDVVADFGNAMNDASNAPGACMFDADCTLQRPALQCAEGARVETCPLALSADVYDALNDRASSLQDELCNQHCGIGVFVDCKSVHAACDMATKTCATIAN